MAKTFLGTASILSLTVLIEVLESYSLLPMAAYMMALFIAAWPTGYVLCEAVQLLREYTK